MGKTALANAACLIAERSSCLVLRARGGELERDVPFGALLRTIELMASLRNADDEISARIETVCTLIDRYGERSFGDLGSAFYGLLMAARRLGPVVLAIDDADLVDDATLTTLQYVFNRVDDQQIWLLLTSSPRVAGQGPRPIDHLLINQHVRHFALEALGAESISSILATNLDQEPSAEFVQAVFEATQGRPEFVVELVKACRSEHVSPIAQNADELDQLTIPRLSQRVLVRLARLETGAAELLDACAINGDRTEIALACHLADIDPIVAEGAADAAARVELLLGGRPLTFVAPIVRWVLLHNIAPTRRSQLHALCAEYAAEGGSDEKSVIEHLLAVEPCGDSKLANRLATAGQALMDQGDFALAARCLRRSVNEGPPVKPDASLWLDLAWCEAELGIRTSLTHLQRALMLGTDDDTKVVRTAVRLMNEVSQWPELRVDAVATMRKLSGRLDAVEDSLQLEFELAMAVLSGHPAQRSDGAAKIEKLLEHSETTAVSDVARTFLDIQRFESDPTIPATTVIEILGKVLNSGQTLTRDHSSGLVLSRACRILLSADEFSAVDWTLDQARRRAESMGDLRAEDDALRLAVLSKLWQGSLDEAEAACAELRRLGATLGTQPVIGLIDLLIAQGRTQEALFQLNFLDPERFDEPLDRASAFVERGRLFALSGQPAEALDEYHHAGEVAESAGIENSVLVGWQPPAASALASLGHWDEARYLAERHLASARSFGARRGLGTALRAMATSTPDLGERISWLTESVEVLEGSPARLETAEALVELGAALVSSQEMDDARNVLHRGANLASVCRAHRLVEVAGSQLRAAGARPRRLGSTGVDSLTPAELRAVHMAAANATNRAIADELFVNVKTIEGHLSRAYRKLGITSRFELAEVLGPRGRSAADDLAKWEAPQSPELSDQH
jgi:DNA-binding CsgD family transcriptional regulator